MSVVSLIVKKELHNVVSEKPAKKEPLALDEATTLIHQLSDTTIGRIDLNQLHVAILSGNTHFLSDHMELLKTLSFGQGITPAHIAASLPNGVEVLKLLKSQGIDINQNDLEGSHPVLVAIEHNQVDVLEFYLDSGFDPYQKDEDGNSPLHLIADQSSFEMIEFCLSRGLNFNIANNQNQTPACLAAHRNDEAITKLLSSSPNPLLTPDSAVNLDDLPEDLKTLTSILKSDLSNFKSLSNEDLAGLDFGYGIKVAHIAAGLKNGREIIEHLASRNIDLNPIDDQGTHPIQIAIEQGNIEIIDYYLKQKGFDLLKYVSVGEIAARAPLNAINYFLERGLNFYFCERSATSPLKIIFDRPQSVDLCQIMMKYGYSFTEF